MDIQGDKPTRNLILHLHIYAWACTKLNQEQVLAGFKDLGNDGVSLSYCEPQSYTTHTTPPPPHPLTHPHPLPDPHICKHDLSWDRVWGQARVWPHQHGDPSIPTTMPLPVGVLVRERCPLWLHDGRAVVAGCAGRGKWVAKVSHLCATGGQPAGPQSLNHTHTQCPHQLFVTSDL